MWAILPYDLRSKPYFLSIHPVAWQPTVILPKIGIIREKNSFSFRFDKKATSQELLGKPNISIEHLGFSVGNVRCIDS